MIGWLQLLLRLERGLVLPAGGTSALSKRKGNDPMRRRVVAGYFKAIYFDGRGTIHEVTRSITKHGPFFRAVSWEFVDRVLGLEQNRTPIETDPLSVPLHLAQLSTLCYLGWLLIRQVFRLHEALK